MKVIITGSTGMVGKGTLLECLESPKINHVLVINRSTVGIAHPKLNELLLANFKDISAFKDQLTGYDACFYCMGTSAVGKTEEQYNDITYNITETFSNVLIESSPDLVFNYVSGSGTDSSEKGNVMWARVKGKTENMVLNKGFKDAYAIRLGMIIPEKGIKSKTGWYSYLYIIFKPFYPLFRLSKNITTTTNFGKAMINTIFFPSEKKHLYNRDLNALANH